MEGGDVAVVVAGGRPGVVVGADCSNCRIAEWRCESNWHCLSKLVVAAVADDSGSIVAVVDAGVGVDGSTGAAAAAAAGYWSSRRTDCTAGSKTDTVAVVVAAAAAGDEGRRRERQGWDSAAAADGDLRSVYHQTSCAGLATSKRQ